MNMKGWLLSRVIILIHIRILPSMLQVRGILSSPAQKKRSDAQFSISMVITLDINLLKCSLSGKSATSPMVQYLEPTHMGYNQLILMRPLLGGQYQLE